MTSQAAGARSARTARSHCTRGTGLLTLMYCRTYLNQDGMAHLFGISQGSISTNISKMVVTAWGRLLVLRDAYEQAKKLPAIEELNEVFPEPVAMTDASEQQPIQKPERPDMEESHYSAKTHNRAHCMVRIRVGNGIRG